MRTLTISQFKAHALGVIKGIAETGERVVVTKRGKPLAVVAPYSDNVPCSDAGCLSEDTINVGDLLAPICIQTRGEK